MWLINYDHHYLLSIILRAREIKHPDPGGGVDSIFSPLISVSRGSLTTAS